MIVPVLGEGKTIGRTIETIYQQVDSESVEVIIADGDPAASTIKVIDDERVVKVFASKGRSPQMNAGAEVARGKILVFLHADTVLPEDAFVEIRSILQEEKIVAGAFELAIDSTRWIYRLISKVTSLRCRMTRIPYGDQAIFIHCDFFEVIGGFTDIPIMEDVDLMQKIKRRGGKISISKLKVKTSPRRWEKEGLWFGILRNFWLITLYSLGVGPEKLVKSYRPHCDE